MRVLQTKTDKTIEGNTQNGVQNSSKKIRQKDLEREIEGLN